MSTSKTKENRQVFSKKENFIHFIKFTGFSISAGLIQTITFTILNETLTWDYSPSYLIALILSVLWNFTINKKFTFKSAANVPVAMTKVAIYYAIFTPLSIWWGEYLTKDLHWNYYVVFAGTILINFGTEFLYQKFFVYRNQINTAIKNSDV